MSVLKKEKFSDLTWDLFFANRSGNILENRVRILYDKHTYTALLPCESQKHIATKIYKPPSVASKNSTVTNTTNDFKKQWSYIIRLYLSERIDAKHQIVQQNSEMQAQENSALQERDLHQNY
jgi:hypothetical protein